MNEMELLRELAQETPLPAPGDLDAARARLVAAITADPATYATAAAQATVHQAYPSTGRPVNLLRPAAPAPVRSAVKVMYGGAASAAAVFLIATLPSIGDIHGRLLGHRVTATPFTITLVIVLIVAEIALWLWMARAVGQGRRWARILSVVLTALATLELQGQHGVLSVFLAWVTFLTGLAVVWLLWRPASRAFFKRYPLRADYAGITLGRQRYPLAYRPAVFVPWADVEQIILYTGYQAGASAPWIGIRRREGAPALPYGNEQAPFCPVPGVVAGATQRIKGLRIDRERLAAVTAAAAPGVSVVEGRYEERFRLTGAAVGPALALLAVGVGLGVLWHTQLVFLLLAIPAVLALAWRPVALLADHAGITLGSERLLPRSPVVVIPWADVQQIILYSGHTSSGDQVPYIGVQRPEGAPALPYGNEQSPWCPVPGVAAGATRRIKRWQLDRERLAAVTAAVAPGIPVTEAGNDPTQRIEGPGQRED